MKRILVIAVPGIGDAFLATPLIRSLKQAYPDAGIDVLVRGGKAILGAPPAGLNLSAIRSRMNGT